MAVTYLSKHAELSTDCLHRYLLVRQWDYSKPVLQYVMLNPSTADGETDDSTTRSCVAIAAAHGFGAVMLTNLFSYRAKDPEALLARIRAGQPVNDDKANAFIRWTAQRCEKIVVAWGDKGTVSIPQIEVVLQTLRPYWSQLYCCGLTQLGNPRHPRFLQPSVEFEPFDGQAYIESLKRDVGAR